MFTIEHEFDTTVITLIDEAGPALAEDITIRAFDDRIEVEQLAPDGKSVSTVRFSMRQLAELRAALDLPEGNYRLRHR